MKIMPRTLKNVFPVLTKWLQETWCLKGHVDFSGSDNFIFGTYCWVFWAPTWVLKDQVINGKGKLRKGHRALECAYLLAFCFWLKFQDLGHRETERTARLGRVFCTHRVHRQPQLHRPANPCRIEISRVTALCTWTHLAFMFVELTVFYWSIWCFPSASGLLEWGLTGRYLAEQCFHRPWFGVAFQWHTCNAMYFVLLSLIQW